MRKLSFRTRMIFLIVSFTAPIVILSAMTYRAHTVNIDFGLLETKGIAYQRPLQKILESVSWHRIYAHRVLLGEKEYSSKLAELQTAINEDFDSLIKIDSELGTVLQFTQDGLESRKRTGFSAADMRLLWNEVLQKKTDDELHLKLIAGLRTMITHLGDTSNLILDPDLDSYYLMDITLLALPQTQDRLQDIIVNVEKILQKKELHSADRSKIAVYSAMPKEADSARIAADIQTATNEDGHFYGISSTLKPRLAEASSPYLKNTENLSSLLHRLIDPSLARVTLNEFRSAADLALASSFAFWLPASEELDHAFRFSTFKFV